MSENNFVSKVNLSTYRVVLWIIEIPNLKEFFLYVPWELSCFAFKLTNESVLVSDNQPQLSRVSDSVLPLADCMKLYYFFHLGDFLSLVITHITPADLGLPQMSKLREGLKKTLNFPYLGLSHPSTP